MDGTAIESPPRPTEPAPSTSVANAVRTEERATNGDEAVPRLPEKSEPIALASLDTAPPLDEKSAAGGGSILPPTLSKLSDAAIEKTPKPAIGPLPKKATDTLEPRLPPTLPEPSRVDESKPIEPTPPAGLSGPDSIGLPNLPDRESKPDLPPIGGTKTDVRTSAIPPKNAPADDPKAKTQPKPNEPKVDPKVVPKPNEPKVEPKVVPKPNEPKVVPKPNEAKVDPKDKPKPNEAKTTPDGPTDLLPDAKTIAPIPGLPVPQSTGPKVVAAPPIEASPVVEPRVRTIESTPKPLDLGGGSPPPTLDTEPIPAPASEVSKPSSPSRTLESTPAEPGSAYLSASVPKVDNGGIRNLGKRKIADDPPQARLAPIAEVADAPLPPENPATREKADPILHTVETGENFWTISRLYYNSGRYYKALHAANRRLVPKIRELYVGSTIKVPPIEDLDADLIDPPAITRPSKAYASKRTESGATATRTGGRVELGLPVAGGARSRDRDRDIEPPSSPIYKVRPYETLRGIARDTLDDPRRAREILELNRDVIDDPVHLTPGQTLTLPDDAVIGRRLR